jgi:uncharacterized protein
MWSRRYWQTQIEDAWKRRNVVWLSGVRRAGKSVLCSTMPNVEVLDCERPSVRRDLEDPESFLDSVRGRRIVLDEIHRLPNPAELLRLAADHYPTVHLLATGSSTLGASARFADTLTDRKEQVWLTPMITEDLIDFEHDDLKHRLLRGGLPPYFLAESFPERDYQDWIDAFWAKDVLELFRLERRTAFQRFFELLMAQSGGLFEASRMARPCEVSRTTISNYLAVLEATYVVCRIQPFSTRTQREIVSAPKIYAFDTGFVCAHRGWSSLRNEDLGQLWEHFVLNELCARLQTRRIRYWRDKGGAEIDFVLVPRGAPPVTIECKWSASGFESRSLLAFRSLYPDGSNYLVAADVRSPSVRQVGNVRVKVVGLRHLIDELVPLGEARLEA